MRHKTECVKAVFIPHDYMPRADRGIQQRPLLYTYCGGRAGGGTRHHNPKRRASKQQSHRPIYGSSGQIASGVLLKDATQTPILLSGMLALRGKDTTTSTRSVALSYSPCPKPWGLQVAVSKTRQDHMREGSCINPQQTCLEQIAQTMRMRAVQHRSSHSLRVLRPGGYHVCRM